MQMRILGASLTLAALTIAASPVHAQNILVIIADDMAVDKVQSYAADYPGYAPAFLPNTRAIDDLAAAGLRFTRAWATPFCSPTRASFQTGVFPFRHGVGTALREGAAGVDTADRLMLAQSFAAKGYQTGYFGKYHIGTGTGPLSRPLNPAPHVARAGWQHFFGTLEGDLGTYTSWDYASWSNGSFSTGTERMHATAHTATVALTWINAQTAPWLAVVAFHAPHTAAGKGWTKADIYNADDELIPVRSTEELACLAPSEAAPSCPDEEKAVYQALVENMDLNMERLLKGINEAAMEETLIVFFGDNGTPPTVQESLFASRTQVATNGVDRGKGTVYENGIRVPLIVAAGVTWLHGTDGAIATPGRVVEEGVHTMDVFQTLHTHAFPHRRALKEVDARSFTDCFITTDVYCGRLGDSYGYSETFDGGDLSQVQIAVRYGHDKLIATYDTERSCLAETFYETDTDLFEVENQTWPGLRAKRLRDYFTTLHASEPTSWATGVAFCYDAR